MKRGIDIGKEIPDVAYNDAHNLILWNGTMEHEAEAHQDPGQVWCCEHQQAEEAQSRIRIPSRPDVDQSRRQRVAQEGHGDERRQDDEACHGVHEQPGEVRRGSTR